MIQICDQFFIILKIIQFRIFIGKQSFRRLWTCYNWAQYKVFSKEETLSHYSRPEKAVPMLTEEDYKRNIDKNISLIEEVVKDHPETSLSPVSFLASKASFKYQIRSTVAAELLIPLIVVNDKKNGGKQFMEQRSGFKDRGIVRLVRSLAVGSQYFFILCILFFLP